MTHDTADVALSTFDETFILLDNNSNVSQNGISLTGDSTNAFQTGDFDISADSYILNSSGVCITDDCGNTSTLEFDIVGKSNNECFRGEIADDATIVEYNKDFAHKIDETLSIVITKGSLYESIALDYSHSDIEIKADSTIKVLSPAYRIHNDNTPLQNSFGLVFTQPVEEHLHQYTMMATVNSAGRLSPAGGKYRHNRLTARSSNFGTFCLVADTTAPTIRPQFEDGADCRGRDRIAFRLSDNFSGVASYNVYIDGKWVATDYSNSRPSVNLKAEGIDGGKIHDVEVVVKDACGNTAKWSGTIKR